MNEISNDQKYENYKAQLGRLNRAFKERFFLEALFIEYAIMEDRTEAILIHAGKKVKPKAGLIQKVDDIRKLLLKDVLLSRYIKPELLDEIVTWSKTRNDYIHALMKQVFTSEQIEEIVLQGQTIIKTLSSKSTSYKRMLERQRIKEGNKE